MMAGDGTSRKKADTSAEAPTLRSSGALPGDISLKGGHLGGGRGWIDMRMPIRRKDPPRNKKVLSGKAVRRARRKNRRVRRGR